MAGRWLIRGDRPADHDTDCVCPACWTRLETVPAPDPTPPVWAGWCGQHGETLGECDPCGPAWTPEGAA